MTERQISIHALREEGDHPKGGDTMTERQISIHALREEGDVISFYNTYRAKNFYPRPPRGGRLPASALPSGGG